MLYALFMWNQFISSACTWKYMASSFREKNDYALESVEHKFFDDSATLPLNLSRSVS